jgi:hypothetical protein
LHFSVGDQVAVVAYREEETFTGASCVIVNPSDNSVAQMLRYAKQTKGVTRRLRQRHRRRFSGSRT